MSEAVTKTRDIQFYSICTTTYNCASVVEKSLQSIIKNANTPEMEFVVCDSKSNDGTPQLIAKFSKFFKEMKIISKKSTRGEGRQIAFENSTGQHIIRVDLDTVYNKSWKEFLKWYADNLPPFAVETYGSDIFPRKLVQAVGGWKGLNTAEDVDLYFKLARIGKMKWSSLITGYNLALLRTWEKIPSWTERWRRELVLFRDFMAIRMITLRQCIIRQRYNPFLTLFDFVARIYAFTMLGVVNVRKLNRDIVESNVIELPVEGYRGRGRESWWSWDFLSDKPIQSQVQDCLICSCPVRLPEKYCPRCVSILKEENLLLEAGLAPS